MFAVWTNVGLQAEVIENPGCIILGQIKRSIYSTSVAICWVSNWHIRATLSGQCNTIVIYSKPLRHDLEINHNQAKYTINTEQIKM
jgi:hypothetical protein